MSKDKVDGFDNVVTFQDKVSMLYTLKELNDEVERAEMFIHRTNNSAERQTWKDRLVEIMYLRQNHLDYRGKKFKNNRKDKEIFNVKEINQK